MRKKYVIDFLYKNYFNARSKAREDVNAAAQKAGYEVFYLKTQTTTEASENKKVFHNINTISFISFRKFLF